MPATGRTPADEMTVAERENRKDKVILYVLDSELVPWTVEEVARELDDQLGVADGMKRLVAAGLVHELGGFVFPTRAARRASEIEAGTI